MKKIYFVLMIILLCSCAQEKKEICFVDGCGQTVYKEGLCPDHYVNEKLKEQSASFESEQFETTIYRCTHENCNEEVYKSGLCPEHFAERMIMELKESFYASETKSKENQETNEAELETIPETTIDFNNSENEMETEPTSEMSQIDSFEHNQYFDVVDVQSYKDLLGINTVYKVMPKETVVVEITQLAYDKEGKIIEKNQDIKTLSKGKMLFFDLYSELEEPANSINISYEVKDYTPEMEKRYGQLDAIEVVDQNITNNDLFLTVKQVKEKVGGFTNMYVFLYKGDVLVDRLSGYVSIYADKLNGVGSTDIVDFSLSKYYTPEFDRIEFYEVKGPVIF